MNEVRDVCICPWAFKSPGILYGVSMMRCWVRLRDDPGCPEHGRTA